MFRRLQQLHLEGNIDEVKHIASVEPNSKSIIISLVCGAINHCPHDIYLNNLLLILIKQTRIRAPINTFTCIHYHPFHTEFLFGRSHKHRRNWPCSSKISSGKEWFIQLSSSAALLWLQPWFWGECLEAGDEDCHRIGPRTNQISVEVNLVIMIIRKKSLI